MNLQQIAQLGRQAAMEKMAEQPEDLSGLDTPIPLEPNVDPSIDLMARAVRTLSHPDEVTDDARADTWARKTIEGKLHSGEQDSPRGALFKSIKEQGKIPPTYRPMTPWPERLFRQRHGQRELYDSAAVDRVEYRNAYARLGSGNQPFTKYEKSLLGIPHPSTVGIGYVPQLSLRKHLWPYESDERETPYDFDGVTNYWATRNHETEHAFQQPARRWANSPPQQSLGNREYEVGPSIGDIIFRAEQFAKEEGKDLEHTVKLPGGVEHDINWMRRQAKEHNYWGPSNPMIQGRGRSMTDLIFNTPEGRAWYKQMVERQRGLYEP